MNELLLVVTIAGERVALPAASIESFVDLEALIAVTALLEGTNHLVGSPKGIGNGLRARVPPFGPYRVLQVARLTVPPPELG